MVQASMEANPEQRRTRSNLQERLCMLALLYIWLVVATLEWLQSCWIMRTASWTVSCGEGCAKNKLNLA